MSAQPAPDDQGRNAEPPWPYWLLNAKRWLLWREEPNTDPTKKPRKVPYYVSGGRREGALGSPDDVAKLATFAEACMQYRKLSGAYTGLGFALGGGFQGIDLDDVDVNGLLDLAGALPGYVEYSPSGKGCHAIGYGNQFTALGSNGSGIEAYCTGRFFTFTGKLLRPVDVAAPPVDLSDFVRQRLAVRHGSKRAAEQATAANAPRINGHDSGAGGSVFVDPKTVTELRSALNAIPADARDTWVNVGMALKHDLGERVGWELWVTWSQSCPEQWNKGGMQAAAERWDGFKPRGDLSIASIFHLAQQCGWTNPASKAAQIAAAAPAAQAAPIDGHALLERYAIDYTSKESVDVPDLVEDLVADEDVTLMGGHGGAGKSFLALQIAIGAATGVSVLGKTVPRKLRVMYYVAEDTKKRVIRRMRAIAAKIGVDLVALFASGQLLLIDATEFDPLYDETLERHESDDGKRTFFNRAMGATVDYGRLSSMVQAFDPDLLIVDGASDTFAGDVIKQRDVKAFLRLLMRLQPARRIGVAVLVHIDRSSARGNKTDDDGYIGAAAWHNSSRRRMYLVPERDKSGKPTNMLTLEIMKHQDGPPVGTLALFRAPETQGVLLLANAVPASMAAMVNKVDEELLDKQVREIVALVAKYDEATRPISTSFNAAVPNSPWKVLSVDPAFPKHIKDYKQLETLVNAARARGMLFTKMYYCKTGQRDKEQLTVRPPPAQEGEA